MPTTSSIGVTPGSGKNPATYSISEDAITKDIARAVLSTATGVDINPANPLAISWIGSTAATVGSKTSANSVPVVIASDQSTITVAFDPGHTLGTVNIGTSAGTIQVFIPDTGHTLGKVDAGVGTFQVFLPDTGHELGSIKGINSTVSVQFSPSTPAVLANTSSTIIIPQTVSGSANGVSVSGNTLISPTTSRTMKVYAYSLTTTGITSTLAKFTNGSGGSPTEYYRVALQSPGSANVGANFGVTPPGYLFASSNGGTISLVLDSGALIHYSLSYFEESA